MARGKWIFSMAAMGSIGLALLAGCSSSSESAQKDTLTQDVGNYPPGPSGVYVPRVGVPQFRVGTVEGMNGDNINDLAADQMTTLLGLTNRFAVIERAQLQQLVKEQGLEGIVESDQLAAQAHVKGVDYLLLGKVTDLSVKKVATSNNFGLAQISNVTGGAEVSNSNVSIKTDCGVDIRLVNSTTGEIVCPNFSEYSKTDSASSMGLAILGANASSSADLELSDDDKGKILRLALDDAIKKDLPAIDNFLRSPRNVTTAPPAVPAAPAGQ
jgi:curli biogenesis system outer membrane secretion channel CsgG